jgi:hypothetical protein
MLYTTYMNSIEIHKAVYFYNLKKGTTCLCHPVWAHMLNSTGKLQTRKAWSPDKVRLLPLHTGIHLMSQWLRHLFFLNKRVLIALRCLCHSCSGDIHLTSYVFWDITLYSPVKVNRRFGGTYCLHLQGRSISQVRNQNGAGIKQRSPYCLLHAYFLLCPLFDPREGGDISLWNFCWLSPDCEALYPRRQNSS